MKQVYQIEIEETLQRVVTTKANSLEEAIDKVEQRYKDEKYVLDYNDFKGVEFREYIDKEVDYKKELKSCNKKLNIESLKIQSMEKAANLLPKDTSKECLLDIAEIIFKLDVNEVGIQEVNNQIRKYKKESKKMNNEQKLSNEISTNNDFYYDFKMLFKRTVKEGTIYEIYIVSNDGKLRIEEYKNGELQIAEIKEYKNTKEY